MQVVYPLSEAPQELIPKDSSFWPFSRTIPTSR